VPERPTWVRATVSIGWLIVIAYALASCGQAPAADRPTGHRTVLRIDTGQSMVAPETVFSDVPVLVLLGDGTVYVPLRGSTGVVRPVGTATVPRTTVDKILAWAQAEGLLQDPPDYTPAEVITDGHDTTVRVSAAGGAWTHVGYMLDWEPAATDARDRLQMFVVVAEGFAWSVAAGVADPVRPSGLRMMARQVSPADVYGDLGAWPADSSVRLADVGGCTVIHDLAALRVLTTSDKSFYRDRGRTYSVAAAVMLPGDSCTSYGGS
jgi:hypothetical protein